MDDAETSRVQFVKQHWQCFGGPLMNVVQQHYPLPLTLKSLETALGYLIRCNLFPVIRNDAGAPNHDPLPLEISLNCVCTAETRKSKEGCRHCRIPQCFRDRANALLYFPLGAVYGERCKIERMIFSMSSDRMTLTIGTAHLVRIAVCHAPNDEKGCFHAIRGKGIEDASRVRGQRAVIKGEDNLMVTEGKRLRILRGADARVFGGLNDNYATRSGALGLPGHSPAMPITVPGSRNKTMPTSLSTEIASRRLLILTRGHCLRIDRQQIIRTETLRPKTLVTIARRRSGGGANAGRVNRGPPGSAQQQTVVGETPNLAARLQGIVEPNTVIIAETTRKMLGNLFEMQDLGAQDLKGIGGRVRAWVALRPSSVESRFEALHGAGLTALVGREEELELLSRRWSRAKSGEGQWCCSPAKQHGRCVRGERLVDHVPHGIGRRSPSWLLCVGMA